MRRRGAAAGLLVGLLAVGGWTGSARAQPRGDDSLGAVDFPVSCSAAAQTGFDRAVALLHHMTYPEARAAFEEVARVDPRCAMAHWGIAMTLFQPLWPTRPGPAELRAGFDHVERALELAPPTERERRFVRAAEAFFADPVSTDYWLRIRRWEAAQDSLFAAFPNDVEAAVFYALAHLATGQTGQSARAHADRAGEILARLYDAHPSHPGVMHYLVHSNDVPGREGDSLQVARRYGEVAPRNPHALHMPTHIYTRRGEWTESVRGNLLAAEAALEQPVAGGWVWDEFPHAIEYLVYAYLQQGADDRARAAWERLRATPRLQPSFKTAFHLASIAARYALERRAWEEARAIEPRQPAGLDWDRFAWPEAIARFARGLGAVRLGRLDETRATLATLRELEDRTTGSGEERFARNIRVLRLELTGWLAHAEGRSDSAAAMLRQAAELESSTPKHAVTPGPTLPADEQLGDLLTELHLPGEALDAYRRSLERYPRRFNSLLGAARAARALGDVLEARRYYRELLDAGDGGSRTAVFEEAWAVLVPRR
ncbi:MAG: hypothetical protein R2909_09900 [Gemmatimonadales bacterium]